MQLRGRLDALAYALGPTQTLAVSTKGPPNPAPTKFGWITTGRGARISAAEVYLINSALFSQQPDLRWSLSRSWASKVIIAIFVPVEHSGSPEEAQA